MGDVLELTSPFARLMRDAGALRWAYLRDVTDLRFLWRHSEGAMGYQSLHGAMVQRLLGGGASGSPSPTRVYPAEQYSCWSNFGSRRAARARRVLHGLVTAGEARFVTVLHAVHGPPAPHADYERLGELAALAEYTPLVDMHRRWLVDRAAEARIRTLASAERLSMLRAPAIEAAAQARLAGARTVLEDLKERKARGALSDDERATLRAARFDQEMARCRLRDVRRPLRSAEDWLRLDAHVRASIDRETTTADALSDLMQLRVERGAQESTRAHAERLKKARMGRAVTIARIRAQALDLFVQASRAYRAAADAL